jgi:hypothetical protein
MHKMDFANENFTVRNNLSDQIEALMLDFDPNFNDRIKAIQNHPNFTDKMKESTTRDIMDEVVAGVSEKITVRLDINKVKASIKNTVSSQMQEERRLTLRAANAGMYDAVMDDFQQNHKDKMVGTPTISQISQYIQI